MSQDDVMLLLDELGGSATNAELGDLALAKWPKRTLHQYINDRLKKLQKAGYVTCDRSEDPAVLVLVRSEPTDFVLAALAALGGRAAEPAMLDFIASEVGDYKARTAGAVVKKHIEAGRLRKYGGPGRSIWSLTERGRRVLATLPRPAQP